MTDAVGDHPEADFFGDSSEATLDGVFCPRISARVKKEGAFTDFFHATINDRLCFWDQNDDPGLDLTFGFIGGENDHVFVDMPCLNRSRFFGAAASPPEKVQQIDEWALGGGDDLIELLLRVVNLEKAEKAPRKQKRLQKAEKAPESRKGSRSLRKQKRLQEP